MDSTFALLMVLTCAICVAISTALGSPELIVGSIVGHLYGAFLIVRKERREAAAYRARIAAEDKIEKERLARWFAAL